MPHRRTLRVRARRASGALLLSMIASVTACAPRATVTVVVDTTQVGGSLEVYALPVPPERVEIAPPSDPLPQRGTPRGDSVARLLALADSIADLDERFQRERTSLNEIARGFAGLDRTSAQYARRYDDHRARLMAAERLRATRDRLRERERTLRRRLGAAAPPDDSTQRARERIARRTAFVRATDGERDARVVRVTAGRVTLELRPGVWWIGAARHETAPDAFTRVELTAGARDTLRIPPAKARE